MSNEISLITQHLFHKDNLQEVSDEELDAYLTEFPFSTPARFLAAKKKHSADPSLNQKEIITAGLYFNNPLWFQWQLTNEENDVEEFKEETDLPEQKIQPIEHHPQKVENTATDESPIVFQSYHTIDYFASQGIRLQQADLGRDKLGQQLKSFTDWLRSMKKLPNAENEIAPVLEDDSRQQHVIRSAASSIEEKDILTETMAEVWAKQGNREKAIDTYNKLSLHNPSKSAYFAAKIDQLK